MTFRLSGAAIIGSILLAGGLVGQGSVPTRLLRTPMDFGAIGDGVADDTDAVQKAIDATQNGGSLYFPGGHKYLVRGLHATGEVHWLGPGGSWLNDRAADGAVIIQGDHATDDLLTLTNAAYSNISGIAFDGNKIHQTKPLNGIRMVNCEFTRCDNIYVTSCSGSGILLNNVNNLQTADEIDFVDCYSVLNGLDGVRFDFTRPGAIIAPGDCEIIGGHYDFNTGAGINLHVSHYTSINGANVLSNGDAGIVALFSTGLNINGNMVRNNGRQGIVLGGGPEFTDCTECTIIANQVHLNSRSGIGKYANVDVGFGSTNTRIIGNYCGDLNPSAQYPVSSKLGIWLHDGAKNTIVVGNTAPAADNVSGGFKAESGATFHASANSGIPNTGAAQAASNLCDLETNSPIWLPFTGTHGGALTLPDAPVGQTVVVKDEGGAAAQHPIAVRAKGATIDGHPDAIVKENHGSLRLRFDGRAWWSW